MQLHFFEEASDEADEARRWYRDRSEAAETAFLRELDHALELIGHAPHRWPSYMAGAQRYVFRTYPYSIVYFVEGDIVNVVAIAHERRRPGYWRKRVRS
jgi:plasmid stabilization system protein ParE